MNANNITTKELSDRLVTSPAYVRRLVGEGMPTAGYIGKQLSFDVEAVKAWLMSQGIRRKRLLNALNVPIAREHYARKKNQRRPTAPESMPETDISFAARMAKLAAGLSDNRGGCNCNPCKCKQTSGQKACKK